MLKSVFAGTALALLSAVSSAGVLTFGSLSLTFSDATLAGATTSSTASSYSINLTSFAQSNFDPNPGEADFAITANSTAADITSIRLTYSGTFTGAGAASFSQTIDGLTSTTGSFSGSTFSQGFFALPSVASADVSGFLNLADNGDSARITQITIDVVQAVPEVSTAGMTLAGLALLVRACRRRLQA